jgi:hypothetical protein
MYVCMHACMHVCMYPCVCTCIVQVSLYAQRLFLAQECITRVYAYTHVCVYIYVTLADTHNDR